MIQLEASDKKTRICITLQQACELKIITLVLQDAKKGDCIPLYRVSAHLLLKIETFLKTGSVEFCIEILKAANYLDFERLVYYLLPEWVNHPKLFPGSPELKGLITDALYFYNGADFSKLKIDPEITTSFMIDAKVCGQGKWAILRACELGRYAVVRQLLQDPRVNPSVKGNGPLLAAVTKRHSEIVELLLQDSRVDPTANGNCVFSYSVGYGWFPVVKLLLQNVHVQKTVNYNDAIKIAAEYGYLDIVDYLLKNTHADPSTHQNYPLVSAAERGHAAVVERLLQDSRVRKLYEKYKK